MPHRPTLGVVSISRFTTLAIVVVFLACCGDSDPVDGTSGDDDIALGVQIDDPTQPGEVVVFDDDERSIVLLDPVGTGDDRTWTVRWDSGLQSGEQPAAFPENLARCAVDKLPSAADRFVVEMRARGLDPGVGAGGDERRAVIDAMLRCDGQTALLELAVSSLPDFDAECLTNLLATDQDFVDLYELQNPDATIEDRRPATERFGPCLDLLANTPDSLEAASLECVGEAQADLGVEMMLGTSDFVRRLLDMFEECLTPAEFEQLNFG